MIQNIKTKPEVYMTSGYIYTIVKKQTKALGREFKGDSPQCWEMSEGQR